MKSAIHQNMMKYSQMAAKQIRENQLFKGQMK